MGHVKLTLSSELLDTRNEELATGHRVYWPIKVPASAKRGGRAEHKGNVALRFKYFDGTRELPKGGSLWNEPTRPVARPNLTLSPSHICSLALSPIRTFACPHPTSAPTPRLP